ncbi:MAG: glycerophosphodiester phosphodiesterase [Rhodobacteraceae bacterium]|nr:glycerophosphodiester phosphodiesterase [Paracoccaceae bacterium]
MSTPRPPLVYGHRGARGVLPENTMDSFRWLRAQGIRGVEIDVQLCADGVPVVIHDPLMPAQLARDAQGRWLQDAGPKIIDLTLAELQRYDVGRLNPDHPYGARYPDQRPADGALIPTLAGFLDWAQQDPSLTLNIEIKSFADRAELGAAPAHLADAVADVIAARALVNPLVISSFDWRVLSALHRIAPDIPRGYLTLEGTQEANIFAASPWMDGAARRLGDTDLPRIIADLGGKFWCPFHRDLTAARLSTAQALGLQVNVWTVNDPDDIARMIAMGVDGIITDYPQRAAAMVSGVA